tara:strand:- start:136 stop:411 length:276 start_codon:yes stop_codon:yes gene_type:complete
MKILIGFLLALFISGQAYSHEDDGFNPYRKSDNKLEGHCIMIEDLTALWLKFAWTNGKDNNKQARQDLNFAKEYSTIYKDLDCREVLKSKL